MAGPIAGVEVPRCLTDAEMDAVWTMINSISSHREGRDFWVGDTRPIGGRYTGGGRPFLLSVSGPEEEFGEDAERYSAEIGLAFGFRPVQDIGFVAMCNGTEDHRVLGEMCLWLARRFGGVVGFGGALLPRLPSALAERWVRGQLSWDDVRPLHERMVEGMPGRLAECLTGVEPRNTWAIHTADAEFMASWLEHPSFHMVK